MIHSWDSLGEEGHLFSNCMENAFAEAGVKADIHHLYLDMVHRPGEVFTQYDWARREAEIRALKPDIILLNDDPVVDWVLTHHEGDSIFKKTPVVFAGVNALLRDSLNNFPLMTGYEDRIDLGRNIELMMRIANTQCLTIEMDIRPIDLRLRRQLEEELADSTRYVNNGDFRLKRFDESYLRKNYPGLAIVNFVSCAFPYLNRTEWESDSVGKARTGKFYQRARDMWQLQVKCDIFSNSIIDRTGRPQFTCIREQFNNSKEQLFLGGYFTGTETQVKDQVAYAVRILHGEKPKSLPISLHTSDYYLDWNAMQVMHPKMAYGVYSNQFKIVNAPFYLEEPLRFAIQVGLIVLLIGLIIYFIVYFMLKWKWKGQMSLVEELQYEEKVHDLMFSNAKDTIWVFKENVFTFTEQFAKYFDLPSNYLTLEEMEHIVHEDTRASFEFLMNFRNQRGRKTVRLHLSPDNGAHWYWAEAMYTATEESAKKGELYGLLLNIDQKKQTEEQLEQAQILASQVALKENFLANISHDLRTPLGAVTGFSTMLTTPGMTFEEGEREMYGDVIHQNTDMILNMIDSVMEKAQIETGDLEIIQKPVSIQKLINECYKTNYIIAPTHLEFKLEMDEPDETINIDMTRTKQVVNNFLSNAFKFTTEGSVTLGWKHMDDDSDMLEVYVRDTGIGVAPEKQAMLFERYQKVNETDKGTGLGLNISKTIMEKQGGTIGVESELGHGSKFFFRLSRIVECLLLIITLGLGLLIPSSCLSRQGKEEKKANVLVYYSYEKNYPGYKGFNEKLLQTFRSQGVNADIRAAYLDLENPNQETDFIHQELKDSLTKIGWTPDVIITEGDRAAHDFIQWREKRMAPELDTIPIVLGGLHHPEWESIRKYNNFVVINDPIDYCTNINLAVEMSGKNCVEIELDFFQQDSLIRRELRQAIARPPYIDNSDFHVDVTADELFSTIWKDSVMVLVYSTESPERNSLNMYERDEGYRALRRIYVHSWLYPSLAVKRDIYSSSIADKTGRPQFTAVKAGFATGDGDFLCGYFAGYETVAQDMARVASEVLKGADLASFVGMTHQKQYYMDYVAMEKLGMEYNDYKDRFIIVGAPMEKISPFYRYATLIIICLVFCLAIGAIVLVLQSWKNQAAAGLIENVTRRAEMRQMALHGADSHMVRTEESLKEIITHVHPDYSKEVPLIMQSTEIIGTHSHEIYADIDKPGNYRWWQLRFVVMYDSVKDEKHVDGILINIDETKRYEEDLRKAMLLAEEAKQKEDFLTTISHEIRTPLNAVVGFSDVLVSMPPESFTPEEMAEYAKIIKANNTSLSAMIEDILMFSRIESGRIQYVKNEFDAIGLVHEVAHDWEDLIPEGVVFKEVGIMPGITIDNDRARVKYILSQLMSNAIKFTKKGVILIGVQYHLNSDKAELYVEDTGCGIPKEKQQLAFGLFWKDDGLIPGLGLGLHVARKLADGMGVVLDVESKPGFGSKFSIYADAQLKRPDVE
ncbi:MAG: HAMP domain-containing histidine kinase [Bacteroidaceae bacterium]|nr:HAMP domain-containing histidine kinase [Bacteroidaceae bacterium]